ncbi:MAG: DUF4157 domain-containing protein [Chitinophagaceae bacterium]
MQSLVTSRIPSIAAPGSSPGTSHASGSYGNDNKKAEDNADSIAGTIMHMPEPNFIQRKCAHCEEKEKAQRKPLASFIQRKELTTGTEVNETISNKINSSRGNGSSINEGTRNFMESRFGADFSSVKIHTDKESFHMNRQLSAKAFTVGNDIYFNEGEYRPSSPQGVHLLAHELTHTIQQNGITAQHNNILNSVGPQIARFTDTSHHITEEAGLAGAGVPEEWMKQIEKGNVKRDYSQLPPVLNFALLCDFDSFGGYRAEEHFDNYIWDNTKNGFRDRGEVEAEGVIEGYKPTPDPIDYIKRRISILMRLGPTDTGLQSLGTAFHAVEDFFAHSNFIELTMNDYRFGHDLITGSNDPGAASIATGRSLNAAGVPGLPVTSPDYIQGIKKTAPALSHSKIAKDYPSDPFHEQAQQLAALVIQDLSRDILKMLEIKNIDERQKACESVVFARIDRYLHPPDPVKDPWWTKLITDDKGAIDILLKKAEEATPVTVNQCVLSPLKNLEATRNSRMRSFGMGNPVISALRLALRPVVGGSLKDIAIGAIPSVTLPFTIRGYKASITLGGMLDIPMGAADPQIPNASKFWPAEDQLHGRDVYEQPQSVVAASVHLTW